MKTYNASALDPRAQVVKKSDCDKYVRAARVTSLPEGYQIEGQHLFRYLNANGEHLAEFDGAGFLQVHKQLGVMDQLALASFIQSRLVS